MPKIANQEGATFKLEAWDYQFYGETLRKQQYDLDNDVVQQYLQLDKILWGMFCAAGQVYGLQFAKAEGLPVAQADITIYKVSRGGKRMGLWYFDPYARDSENSGAWMSVYRTQERFRQKISPIVSNNANFMKTRPGEPTPISWDDASTMFHELGHALHGLQSNVTYPTLAGTAEKRDFVDFPSQVNERWLPTAEVLSRSALHHNTGKTVYLICITLVGVKRCDAFEFNPAGGATSERSQFSCYAQQPLFSCTGGHFTLPKEQNTQQSPVIGLSILRHPLHS